MAAKERAHEDGREWWARKTDAELWGRIASKDSVVVVGLKAPGSSRGVMRGRTLVDGDSKTAARRRLVDSPGISIVAVDTLLPIVRVKLASRQALGALRRLPFVDYVEPLFFGVPTNALFHSWGCGAASWSGGLQYLPDGDVLPQNYDMMDIPRAWQKSSGQGVTLGLVDTGIDPGNPQLNAQFASGSSTGRTILVQSTATGGWGDLCGHGTHMASVLAAPRNGTGIVGVAWKANLHAVKSNGDVMIDGTNVEDVRMGIRTVGATSKIIVMAFGSSNAWLSISDEIDYWYYNYDRLFVGAAGTTTAWLNGFVGVVFPAWKVEVVAVSGHVCGECSYGTAVDLTAHEDQPAEPNYMIGESGLAGSSASSNATAVVAGIAALVWAKYPSATRDNVKSRLFYAADPTGGNWTWNRGWGSPNAFGAVGGMFRAWIDGQNLIEHTGYYTYTAEQAASAGPFSYQWSTGETTQSVTRFIPVTYSTPETLITEIVTITDLSDGTSKTVDHPVFVRQPTGCPTCP